MTDDLSAVFRREAGRCTATLIRILGDVDLAEDAVAEAFAIAAARWPVTGLPPNPGGWITTTARNRAIDRLRRDATRTERHTAAHHLHRPAMDHNPELDELDRASFSDTPPGAWRRCETEAVSAAPTLLVDGREIDVARLAEICARFGVVELAVFGSTIREEATRDSDIDLLYVLAPDRRLGFAVDRLEDELSDLFGRQVDLVSKKALHRLLRAELFSEARTLYAA